MAIDVHTLLSPGTEVEVSNLFTGRWTTGFRIVGREADGYRIALSDGSQVPAVFPAARLRPVETTTDQVHPAFEAVAV